MRVAKVGFLRWLGWAFFSPSGQIKRLPFAGTSFLLYLLLILYTPIAAQILAVYILPPPGGGPPSVDYVRGLALSPALIPLLLPGAYMRLCLDLKRLHSIGAPRIIAVPFVSLFLFAPLIPANFSEISSLGVLAYLAILAAIPAREDRMDPLERKYRTWQAIATGNGTARRLSGREILSWRVVRQGPDKK
ncbi:MAG: hypothetical protein FWG04_00790 [Desulfovibrionaceae bacterium]|nr:hypothetical protein [Desulfovibrionaceae bacterium]